MAKTSDDLSDHVVCFVGDSIIAGKGDSSGLGWTARVAADAHHAGVPILGLQLGIPGESSVQIAQRWSEVEHRASQFPRMAVVAGFGVNDTGILDGTERVSEKGTGAAIAEICRRVPPGHLLIVGPAPMEWAERNERIAARSNLIEMVCRDFGVPFINTYGALIANHVWMEEVSARDGAHPDAEGYQEFAKVVSEPIIRWLTTGIVDPSAQIGP